MLLNCGVGGHSWESLGLQGDPTSPFSRKSVLGVHWKDWCWSWDDRGWNGWMASPTQWTWVCVNSGSLQWTGRPGVLQSMGSQRVGHDWVTELNWTGFFKIYVFKRCHIISINCLQFLLKFWKTNIISPDCIWEAQVSESQSVAQDHTTIALKFKAELAGPHIRLFLWILPFLGILLQNHMTTKPYHQTPHPQICQFIGQTFSRSFFHSHVWQWDVTHTGVCR